MKLNSRKLILVNILALALIAIMSVQMTMAAASSTEKIRNGSFEIYDGNNFAYWVESGGVTVETTSPYGTDAANLNTAGTIYQNMYLSGQRIQWISFYALKTGTGELRFTLTFSDSSTKVFDVELETYGKRFVYYPGTDFPKYRTLTRITFQSTNYVYGNEVLIDVVSLIYSTGDIPM